MTAACCWMWREQLGAAASQPLVTHHTSEKCAARSSQLFVILAGKAKTAAFYCKVWLTEHWRSQHFRTTGPIAEFDRSDVGAFRVVFLCGHGRGSTEGVSAACVSGPRPSLRIKQPASAATLSIAAAQRGGSRAVLCALLRAAAARTSLLEHLDVAAFLRQNLWSNQCKGWKVGRVVQRGACQARLPTPSLFPADDFREEQEAGKRPVNTSQCKRLKKHPKVVRAVIM